MDNGGFDVQASPKNINVMTKRFVKLVVEFLAGISGNLIASWIGNDIWASVFNPVRLVGTVLVGVMAMLVLSAWTGESRNSIFRKQYQHSSPPRSILDTSSPRLRDSVFAIGVESRRLSCYLLLGIWLTLALCFLTYAFTSIFYTPPGFLLADADETKPFLSTEMIEFMIAITFYPLALTALAATYRYIRPR